jgi:hypothetical protein
MQLHQRMQRGSSAHTQAQQQQQQWGRQAEVHCRTAAAAGQAIKTC